MVAKDSSSMTKPFFLRRKLSLLSHQRLPAHCNAVVFISDDWGFCGWGKDRKTLEELCAKGYNVFQGKYWRDTLESSNDLLRLYDTLSSVEDVYGRKAIFSANFICSNPDYTAIKNNSFKIYHYIPICRGFPGTWNRGNLLQGWKDGIRRGVFFPEYHGLTHFDQDAWLEGLRRNDKQLLDFFEHALVTSSRETFVLSEYGNMRKRRFKSLKKQLNNIKAGFKIFTETFTRQPFTTLAPNNYYNITTKRLFDSLYHVHWSRDSIYPWQLHSLAASLVSQPYELVRNVNLEIALSSSPESEYQRACEDTINLWKHRLPAVVNTHRINYVTGVDASITTKSFYYLSEYLKFLASHRDLVFLTDHEAFQLLEQGYSCVTIGNETVLRNYTSRDIIFRFERTVPYNYSIENVSGSVRPPKSEVTLRPGEMKVIP
jgi:hypothetical protein